MLYSLGGTQLLVRHTVGILVEFLDEALGELVVSYHAGGDHCQQLGGEQVDDQHEGKLDNVEG